MGLRLVKGMREGGPTEDGQDARASTESGHEAGHPTPFSFSNPWAFIHLFKTGRIFLLPLRLFHAKALTNMPRAIKFFKDDTLNTDQIL